MYIKVTYIYIYIKKKNINRITRVYNNCHRGSKVDDTEKVH